MMEVIVEHDYTAIEANELTITKGDIIKDVVIKQGGWWEGTLDDRKGLFPDNFVKVIDKDPSIVLRNKKDATRIRQCRVIFSYKQDHEDELTLEVGDIIEIIGEEEEGWWRGLLNGKQGVFPSNFVEEIPTKADSWEHIDVGIELSKQPQLPAKPTKIFCIAQYPYKSQKEDELTLNKGDVITLITKDTGDSGWWKGELSGLIGVFPDNFVTVVADNEDIIKDDKKLVKNHLEHVAIKPSMISPQRKSLEIKNNDKSDSDTASTKSTPPVPSKKPIIPLKKSPSGSSSSGGIFYGLKKKMKKDSDSVDGAISSKNVAAKTESNNPVQSDNAFDDIVRRPLLSDVRASRPKAPGRRPPSVVFKESETNIVNGNTEHSTLDALNEQLLISETDGVDNKPKLREWEKHKAPWLEEMKLNQAKRTSTSPGPEHKLKLTPTTDKMDSSDEQKIIKETTKDLSPIDNVSKSITTAFNNKLKTPPNELDKTSIIRNKHNLPIMPTRPHSIQNISTSNDLHLSKPITKVLNTTPSPSQKLNSELKMSSSDTVGSENVTQKQFLELVERVSKLEEIIEKQNEIIEELKAKLQLGNEIKIAT